MRELDSALGVAELAVDGGEVGEALTEAIYGEVRSSAGDGSGEPGFGDVLENLFHGVDEVDVEALGVRGFDFAANGGEDRRRRVIVGISGREEEDEEE